MFKFILFLCIFCAVHCRKPFKFMNAERPCAARQMFGQSVVCVCNSTYCDEIIRKAPAPGTFVAYSSSMKGSRFVRMKSTIKYNTESYPFTIYLKPEVQFQTIEGFGGAVTDAAAINWKRLAPPLREHIIRSYFSIKGLEYNMLRVPIGGTDFSVRGYSYNDLPINDTKLSNFTLAEEDIKYKIPLIKRIFGVATSDVHIVATTWSPPPWMKNSHKYTGSNHLLEEFYQTYADYHLKFLQSYARNGVPIWAITTTNEPTNGILSNSEINCLGWMPSKMGKWISQNLGPTIRNSTFKDVKILANDDQRYVLPVMFEMMIKTEPAAYKYIDGVAVHYYSDSFTPTYILKEIARDYPDKFILATEACEGSFPWETKVLLGSWWRAVTYVRDIISDINSSLVGWIDWNLCLDKQGGPNWVNNFVDAPIIVFPEKNEFIKQPTFYAMGHFSKFVPRGSKRILSEGKCDEDPISCLAMIEHVAFLTPKSTVVVVIYNPGKGKTLSLVLGRQNAILLLEDNSITTVEIPYTL